jgi:cell division protein FtsN
MKPPKKPSTKYAKPTPPSRGGTMLGLLIGLVIGVLIAFGVVWYLNKTPLPFQDKSGRSEKKEAAEKEKNGAPGQPRAPDPLPGKPGDKVSEKPRFEFYKILPGGQEASPAPGQAAPQAKLPVETPAQGERLYLQAGAFQKAADADNLKARLALTGIEAAVQEASVPDKGTLYRVRIGPFARTDELNRIKNQLAQDGIHASLVKVKDGVNN